MIIENGNAATREAVCKPFKPLAINKTVAIAAWKMPHTNLTKVGGFGLPFVVIIPNTKVAESADVTRNVKINAIDSIDNISPNGR